MIGEIKKELVGKNTVSFSFKSGDIDGVLVFLDGQFLGKTPLQRSDILPGNRKVKYYMDGFQSEEKKVSIQDGGSFEMILSKTPKDGLISVTSNPEGASVYLGSEFLGKTPITNIRVKTGYNRLRLSMEGHVDLLKGVEIKKDEETKLDLVLNREIRLLIIKINRMFFWIIRITIFRFIPYMEPFCFTSVIIISI